MRTATQTVGDDRRRAARAGSAQRRTAAVHGEFRRFLDASSSHGLVGLEAETMVIERLLEDLAAGEGSTLIVSGDMGVGKSALLDFAGAGAAPRGLRVLRGAGTDSGAALSFLALAQLLLPLRAELDVLPTEYRDVLRGTLGLRRDTGEPPGRLLVCNAVLALLLEAAKHRPTLLIVDDLHGLDRASAMVLSFVARAATGTRLGFVGAARAVKQEPFGWLEFPQQRVEPLGPATAHALLRARFPSLPTSLRRRVVDESDGLPLALLEFAAAFASARRAALEPVPSVLPLPRRFRSLLAARMAELPEPTRRLLLLAALDGSGDLRVLRAAAESDEVLDHLDAAERAGLVDVHEGGGRLTFRPLIRSAIVNSSTSAERRRAHRTLAGVSPDGSEQRALHLGHATVGPDESVAEVVERSARVSLRRGDVSGAVHALIRASQLSADPAGRGRRMAEAAYIAAELGGEPDTARRLLEDARRNGADVNAPLRVAMATTTLLLNGGDGGDVAAGGRALVDAIEAAFGHQPTGDVEILDALHTLAAVCRIGEREDAVLALGGFVERLRPTAPLDLRLRAASHHLSALDPGLLHELDLAIEGLEDAADPFEIVKLAIACVPVDRLPACVPALERVIERGEAAGAVACVVHARWLLGSSAFGRGDWDDAQAHFDAGLSLCGTFGLGGLRWAGIAGLGLLAAGRGDVEAALASAEELTAWASPRGARTITGYASSIVAMTAVSEGHVEAAFAAATAGADLPSISPRHVCLDAARAAMTAPAAQADALFERALSVPDADRWVFEHACVRLAFGEHLRRARSACRAREQLRLALVVFERLSAAPWVARARAELAATGERRTRADDPDAPLLTPQELEIARLAARGLSNKEIGARVHLSHRTVSTHLYRIFPRLGITSRTMLRDALGDLIAELSP